MPYGPHTPEDRARMLAAIGVASVDDLFDDIPEALRGGGLNLPAPQPEMELSARLEGLAARNRVNLASFLGAGVYRHFAPAAVDQMLLRGEWYTAYTPYQPEVSQGTLQSIYEYESLIGELMSLDVVSASHYDGATATAEAAMMAVRQTRRTRLLVSRAVHPHYRGAVRTYAGGNSIAVEEIPLIADGEAAGTTDLAALERMLAADSGDAVAGVLVAQPNFLGLLEPMAAVSQLTHAAGAKFIAVVEPVSLAVLAPPGAYDADIAAGEGQPLGIAPQYGGPYLGILACTNELVRQIPGRLIGMTKDLEGRRAFVMTMRAREQDIRREKAASSITTNQTLLALAASIYMATMGPKGLADVASLGAARAGELEAALADAGAPRIHGGAYLNEFAIHVPNARAVHRGLLDRGVLAGLALADAEPDDESLRDALLVCATEVTTSDEIRTFATALREELAAGSSGSSRAEREQGRVAETAGVR